MRINFKKNYFTKIISFIVFAIFTFCILLYLPCDIYNFPSFKKFSGEFLYNPYKGSCAAWQKTNFHAHAIAWDGITNGDQPAQTILDLYKQKGYAYSCISNYENVANEDDELQSINVYEHGYNIGKVHQLVIMPQKVCYTDFPFFQSANTKQFIINKLSASAKAVALPHPMVKNGYSNNDLKKLSGYNLIEVLNHAGNATCKWDIALSAGKPVWIVGDDDTHDAFDMSQTFNNWTMIDCNHQNKDLLVENLINGNAYAVNGKNAVNDNRLINLKVNGIHVSIQLQNNADSIQLVGQNGIKRKTFFNTSKADYTFLNNDTYIRAVVYNKATTMFLNPVIRFDGNTKPQNIFTATIYPAGTILYRSFLIVCWMFLYIYFNRRSAAQLLSLLKKIPSLNRKAPKLGLEV
jgi:hypothetical protein